MSAINTISNTLSNTPLYLMVEKMGLAIANAQKELDANSIRLLKELGETEIEIGGEKYNLITLGFTPTFYAFTEASFEAKLEFSMAESTAFSIGAEVGVSVGVVTAAVNASYARKFEQSAEGSSSISAKMVSLPAPENLMTILKESIKKQ